MGHVHLDGSEQVQSAGAQIAAAAVEMTRAAMVFEESVNRLQGLLREHADLMSTYVDRMSPEPHSA